MRDPGTVAEIGFNLVWLFGVYFGQTPEPRMRKQGPDVTAVVMGAEVVSDGRPSGTLRERTLHAARMYADGRVGRIVVTGGIGENPPAEAEVMAGILTAEGVPEEAIVREEKALNSWDSAVFVGEIYRGASMLDVVVVTDPLHCIRTAAAFRWAGLDVEVEPVRESPMWRDPRRRLGQLIRETGAIMWYGIRYRTGSRYRR